MKYIRIFSIAAVAALVFSACQKTSYPEFTYGPEEPTGKVHVYFDKLGAEEEIDPDATTYSISVNRSSSTGALSVPVVVEDPEGVFVVPATVDFADGAATSNLVVDISAMKLSTPYSLKVSIPADYSDAYASAGSTSFIFVGVKQKWVDLGEFYFYEHCIIGSGANVHIEQVEGGNKYRIVNPFKAVWGGFGVGEANIVFTVKNGEVVFEDGVYDFAPGSGYYFYYASADYPDYCYWEATPNEKDDTMVDLTGSFLSLSVSTSSIEYIFPFWVVWPKATCPVAVSE